MLGSARRGARRARARAGACLTVGHELHAGPTAGVVAAGCVESRTPPGWDEAGFAAVEGEAGD